MYMSTHIVYNAATVTDVFNIALYGVTFPGFIKRVWEKHGGVSSAYSRLPSDTIIVNINYGHLILKSTISIWTHCDPTVSHVMDI